MEETHEKKRMSYAEAGLLVATQQRRRNSTLHRIHSSRMAELRAGPSALGNLEEESHASEVKSQESVIHAATTLPTEANIEHHARRKGQPHHQFHQHGGFSSDFHRIMFRFVESKAFSGFILVIILLNTAILVGQTFPEVAARGSWYFSVLDNVFLGIYIMEAVLKMYVWRRAFFKEGWNVMDLTIVIFNLLDFLLPLVMSVGGFNGAAIFRLLRIFRAIRAIRALRVLRTIRFLSNLQVIVTTCLKSIQSMGAIVMLMFLFMYMFAVIGQGLYGSVDPKRFGRLFNALFTTFQLLTLDEWFDIYVNARSKGRDDIILYLLLYIVVEYFIFLNLFVAVLVDNFQLTLEAQNEANKKKKELQDDLSDDEGYMSTIASSEESLATFMSDEERPPRKVIGDYYHDGDSKDAASLNRYFQLLTALEYNTQMLHNQQRTIDLMVDMCAITEEDN